MINPTQTHTILGAFVEENVVLRHNLAAAQERIKELEAQMEDSQPATDDPLGQRNA